MRLRVQEENRQEEILVEKLLEGVSMEFPPSILERRKEEISMGRRFRLMRDGKSPEEVDAALAGDDASIEEEAREELKSIFVLDEIADRETVLVTEDEIRNRIQAIAMTSRRDPQEVADVLEQTKLEGNAKQGRAKDAPALPPGLGANDFAQVYEVPLGKDRTWTVEWQLRAGKAELRPAARVPWVNVTSVISEEGPVRHRVIYRVRNLRLQFLALELPAADESIHVLDAAQPTAAVLDAALTALRASTW